MTIISLPKHLTKLAVGLLFCALIYSISKEHSSRQQTIPPSKTLGVDYDFITCTSSGKSDRKYIPAEDLKALKNKGLGNLGDFEVRYSGFTPEAEAAFQFAVDIWDMYLDSDTKIVVDANFADLGSGALGSAAPTAMFWNFSDKVDQHVEYSISIAEKILGQSLNGNEADLRCNFSSTANWYYDTDNPEGIADNQTDFATVVLHELGHGIGFLSRHTFAANSGAGFIRANPPIDTDIFSLLLETGDGTNIFLNTEEGSDELGAILTSENVFIHTHTVLTDPLPSIFAPDPWNGGSSLSHLDEFSFNGSDPLMTPFIGQGEVVHDPQISLDLLNDMGWRSSFIAHRPVNVEIENGPLTISAEISTDDGVGFDSSSVKIIYSQDSFRMTTDTLVMSAEMGSPLFSIDLPLNNTERYQYAIILDDTINHGYSSPLVAPEQFHDVRFGIDDEGPSIEHTSVDLLFLNEGNPDLTALVVDDFMGVDTVYIEFMVNQGLPQSLGLTEDGFNQFSQTVDLSILSLEDGDSISYRIIATDNAMTVNTTILPESGFFVVNIKAVPDAIETYVNDFNEASEDFSGIDFSIRTEDGFDDGALHTVHPYPTAGGGNEIDLITRLRKPIRVVDQGRIEFDEVVLVEPSEPGETFGGSQFWDYVIVEASKDDGATWIPLLRGYDSRDKTLWKNAYDSGLSGQISTSPGNKSLLFNKSFRLHQPSLGIEVDDIVVLRWRLYSDPFAAGWGWVIDNLEIQNTGTTPIAEVDEENKAIAIAPNPITDNVLSITITGDLKIRSVLISDVAGRMVQSQKVDLQSKETIEISIRGLESGVYHAVFETDGVWITKPFLKL